jgi:hypothetical protein
MAVTGRFQYFFGKMDDFFHSTILFLWKEVQRLKFKVLVVEDSELKHGGSCLHVFGSFEIALFQVIHHGRNFTANFFGLI